MISVTLTGDLSKLEELSGRLKADSLQAKIQSRVDKEIARRVNAKSLHGAAWTTALDASIDTIAEGECQRAFEGTTPQETDTEVEQRTKRTARKAAKAARTPEQVAREQAQSDLKKERATKKKFGDEG